MNTNKYTIRIENEKFGTLLNESFVDATQFKLFLKMVNGCAGEPAKLHRNNRRKHRGETANVDRIRNRLGAACRS